MKLLAIPNDTTSSYSRNYEKDFLSEFNPTNRKGKRTFEKVRFLNWKDKKSEEIFGIKSYSLLQDKSEANQIMKDISKEKLEFKSPLFKDIFYNELDKIDKIMKEYDPNIVRAFNTHFAGELGSIIKSEYNIPLVISAHDPSRLTSIISKADSLVCISEDLANKSISQYGVDKSKITIIPDGIDMDYFYPRKKNQIGFDAKCKILSVGRIVPSKNIETLLESISIAKKEFKDIKHIHLGKGNEESVKKINEIKNDLRLESVSFFLGGKQKQELPFYYSWADVYALPTLWEGLGRAQIESLACGTPVITTNYAPMTEIVTSEENGLLANPKNAEDFANKIILYFKDNKLRKHLENNARKSVHEKYNTKKVMKMHSENYRKLLNK